MTSYLRTRAVWASVWAMDAASALADLTEISSQVETAAVLAADGTIVASTLDDAGRNERLVRAAGDLLAAGDELAGERKLTQLEAALRGGSVFVVRDGDRAIVATTTPAPTSGLVFYDLQTCLRSVADEPAPKPRRRTKKAAADA